MAALRQRRLSANGRHHQRGRLDRHAIAAAHGARQRRAEVARAVLWSVSLSWERLPSLASCAGLTRASRPSGLSARPSGMAGTSPAMTTRCVVAQAALASQYAE